jgi:hypothetical protein
MSSIYGDVARAILQRVGDIARWCVPTCEALGEFAPRESSEDAIITGQVANSVYPARYCAAALP